ncbi:MAG: hypothetical protein FWC85_04015, partial [Elusimicrobia bacterium]|nr:hypothetical protein [Elusimicrobiota bacterium]
MKKIIKLCLAVLLSFFILPFGAYAVTVSSWAELQTQIGLKAVGGTETFIVDGVMSSGLLGTISPPANTNLTFIRDQVGTLQFTGGASDGPFFNAGTGTTLTFIPWNTTSFNNSNSSTAGGALSSNGATFNFLGSTVFFANNSTTDSVNGGGAIFLQGAGSNVTFNQTGPLSAANNTALNGNGGFLMGAAGARTITFDNSSSFFIENSAQQGGAIFLQAGTMNFYGNANFIDNTSLATSGRGGGAIALGNTNTTFAGYSYFTNNSAALQGGALDLQQSTVTFNGSATFENNTAGAAGVAATVGGAIRMTASTLSFNGALTQFINNTNLGTIGNSNPGGAIFLMNNSTLTFGQSIDDIFIASGNSSPHGAGGFLHSISPNTITFNATSTFTNNSATNGGVINIWNGGQFTFNNASFLGNSANVNGGAIFAQGSPQNTTSLTFNTLADGQTLFQGNTAGGVSSGLHIEQFTNTTFNTAAGGNVWMNDGMSSNVGVAGTAVLNIMGDGVFNLNAVANT